MMWTILVHMITQYLDLEGQDEKEIPKNLKKYVYKH